jgi:hypothetical protein
MKTKKLLVIAASVCLLAVFVAGSAYAQVAEIIADYCEEVGQNVTTTLNELDDASGDLQDCSVELDDCLSGLFQRDPVKCIRDYSQCINFGENDQRQACQAFLLEFGNDTRRALRSADRQDVEEEFLLWLNGDSTGRNECLNPAQATAFVCADQTIGE